MARAWRRPIGKTKWYEWVGYAGLAIAAVGLALLTAGASIPATVCFAAGAVAGGLSAGGHLADTAHLGTATTATVVLDVAQIAASFASFGARSITVKVGSAAAALAGSRWFVPLVSAAAGADAVQLVALTDITFVELGKIQNGAGSAEDKLRAMAVLLTQLIVTGGLTALSVQGARSVRALSGRPLEIVDQNGVKVLRVVGEETPAPVDPSNPVGKRSEGTGTSTTDAGGSEGSSQRTGTATVASDSAVSNTVKHEPKPRRLGPGEDFSAHVHGSDGVLASLGQDGILDLYIKAGGETPRGGEMFNEALRAYGSNVKGIRGTWLGGGELSSNFDAYKANIKVGLDPKAAAVETFTGKMATRAKFTKVTIVSDTDAKVVVEFTR